MSEWLLQRWYGDSAPLLLRPLAALYGAAVRLRHRGYARGWLSSHRVDRPVVVVGNLTVGGTGKTPLVVWLARALKERGLNPGIVSRGYGRSSSGARVVEQESDWQEVGDEPLLIRKATGCVTVVSADRVAGARMLVERGANVIIADDGLQHLRLARDCEVVILDGSRGFGNGYLLPAGPLREPRSRLASVDILVSNGPSTERASFEMTLTPRPPMPVVATSSASLPSGTVHGVAGIGNPQRFFATLRQMGFQVIEHPFPDHHGYASRDLQFGDSLPVLMTEKDAVKCRAFAEANLWYVPVEVHFGGDQAEELLGRVLRRLRLKG